VDVIVLALSEIQGGHFHMKKMVAAVATGIVITGTAAASVSAADYQVKPGDTLWNIAQTNNTTVDSLIKNNGLKGTIIYPNQTLSVDGNAQASANQTSYKVKAGDTLGKIASANGTSVASLKQWNNLASDLIIAGQTLYLEAGHVQSQPAAQPAQTQSTPQAQQSVKPAAQAPAQEAKPAAQAPAQQAKPAAKPQVQQTGNAQGKKITVSSTAYTADCAGCSGVTATGMDLKNNRGAKVIAVDPSVIPLGSKVYVPGYGTAIAADTGGAIQGNRIDVHVASKGEAYNWGRRTVTVTVIN